MSVNKDGVLHVPLQPRLKGRCAAANAYTLSHQKSNAFKEWRNTIEEKYDVRLHQNPDNTISIATENALMGVLVGENFLNGRTQQMIIDFRRELLGRVATGLNYWNELSKTPLVSVPILSEPQNSGEVIIY